MIALLIDQVFLDVDVEAEAGRRDGEHAIALLHRQAQAGQRIVALLLRERHADDLGRTRHAQRDGLGLGHVGLLVVDGAADGLGRAADRSFSHAASTKLKLMVSW